MSCLCGDWFCPLLSSPTVQACSFLKRSALRHLCLKAFGMFGTPGLFPIWPPLEATLLGVLFHPGTTTRGHSRHPWLAGPRLKMKHCLSSSCFWKKEKKKGNIFYGIILLEIKDTEPRCDRWISLKKERALWDFPGGPVAKMCFRCRGPWFDPLPGNYIPPTCHN